MALGDNLRSEVRKVLQERWTTKARGHVPESVDLDLRNDAVTIHGTVLYADLDGSTRLVDTEEPWFAAEIYKSYLTCAARIVEAEGGVITAYDGDRIMAVYTGKNRNNKAVKSALKVNYAVQKIINPAIVELYPNSNYSVRQSVGVDTSELFVTRTGIRGANDLVWVGRAANHAAKLSSRPGAVSQITSDVYNRLSPSCKVGSDGRNMWSRATAQEIGNRTIYTSGWTWQV
jgi:class 3 adenylate cyclase